MNYKSHELLIHTFSRSNPVFFKELLERIIVDDEPYRNELAKEVLGHTSLSPFQGHFHPDGSSPAEISLQSIYGTNAPPKERLFQVNHVFPVWQNIFNKGLMVPLGIAPTDDWQISDAFGKFNFFQGTVADPPFIALLKIVENAWKDLRREFIPLRWRQSFSLKILCPIHLDAIDGQSLHVPMIIAVLRALSFSQDTLSSSAVLPFGNGPIFATGVLRGDRNTFGAVQHVQEKLEGFVREYGTGLPAILQQSQIEEIDSDLLSKVTVFKADSINELLCLPELADPLSKLSGPVHAGEIDKLLVTMTRYVRSVRFGDVSGMVNWLLPHVGSPIYRFQLHRHAGQMLAHRGSFIQANEHLNSCSRLLRDHPDLFGLTDRCDLGTSAGVLAVDALDSDLATTVLDELTPHLGALPVAKRVAYWGSKCQLLRLEERYDEAIAAGEESVRLADLGRASDSGRDRNYLIHALLARARSNYGAQGQHDLARASSLLAESQGDFAPCDDRRARQSHLTFCLHFSAELARLQGRSFDLPDNPPWKGDWDHAWYFALLSCARNEQHGLPARIRYCDNLVKRLQKRSEKYSDYESLFFMFLQVYRVYQDLLYNQPWTDPLRVLREWCASMEERGFPGWKHRLSSCLDKLEQGNREAADRLCELIHYH
ncbi:hypothetical protein [uncultured Desulfobulbus sp.]|uniref:hypothetical protein n=1 Tax=uncultured Desulfobulbus sp. TaxID=239745 RepID=UPI0029C7176A|nr:hypothetical protein [uncultured Desulfobulbus sp.]